MKAGSNNERLVPQADNQDDTLVAASGAEGISRREGLIPLSAEQVRFLEGIGYSPALYATCDAHELASEIAAEYTSTLKRPAAIGTPLETLLTEFLGGSSLRDISVQHEIRPLSLQLRLKKVAAALQSKTKTNGELRQGGDVHEPHLAMLVVEDEVSPAVSSRASRSGEGGFELVDDVRTYLNSIGKIALLNAEQEVEYAKDIEAGLYAQHLLESGHEHDYVPRDLRFVQRQGELAKRAMLEANTRLVVSVARKYRGGELELIDRIQEGNVGLVRAVEKFDYAKGFKFSTYATWWIRQAITRGMADQSRTIRLPVHMVEQVNKLSRIKREISQNSGRDATIEELVEAMGLPEKKITDLIMRSRSTVSLDTPVGDDEEAPLGDFIGDDDQASVDDIVIFSQMQADVRATLATLDEREQQVISLRYGFNGSKGYTLDSIGKMFGLSRERVRQIEREAMEKLRSSGQAQQLREYIDL